jgi:hypothetical protein
LVTQNLARDQRRRASIANREAGKTDYPDGGGTAPFSKIAMPYLAGRRGGQRPENSRNRMIARSASIARARGDRAAGYARNDNHGGSFRCKLPADAAMAIWRRNR